MLRKILIAHDLSRRSSMALMRAAQLASQTGADLEVLHLVEADLPDWVIERRELEARTVIGDEVARLPKSRTPDIETRILAGRDYTDILARAETSAADLIVLAVHREDALRSVVIGTTAERIIGFGSRPVLIVRNPPHGAYRRLVAAVDFTPSAQRAAAFALELLPPESEIRLVHAAAMSASNGRPHGRETDMMEGIRSELGARTPASVQTVLRHGPPVAIIRNAVEESQADLLAVGAQRRSGLTRALIGEIPEDLLARPPCDVLVVHA